MNIVANTPDDNEDIQVYITLLCNNKNERPIKGIFQVAARGIKINEVKLIIIGDKKIIQYPSEIDPKTGKSITLVFPFEKTISEKIREKILALYDCEYKKWREKMLIA